MQKSVFNNLYHYLNDYYTHNQQVRQEEPEVIAAKRDQAFAVFREKGFPSVKNEDWKYTNITRLLKDDFRIVQSGQEIDLIKPAADGIIEGLDAYRIVLLNGKFIKDLSDSLPGGITWLDTREALAHPLTAKHLGTIAKSHLSGMPALNTAFFNAYNLLHIPAKATMDKPVHILHLYSSKVPLFVPHRLMIVADKLSEVTVIETFQSIANEAPIFISYTCEQWLGEAAVANLTHINNLSANAYFVHHREAQQQARSVLHHANISFPGAPFIRNDINARLLGVNTETNLWGLYLSGNRQLVDNHTIVDHQMPNCNSTEWYKGILQDKSSGIFNGKIFVEKDAQKTNAFQQNNNLLLSEQATINTKPQLEIFADDVKCSHGATVGQINNDALFYLKSRGISDETAHHLLVEAFAYDVLSKIEIEALQEYIHHHIRKNLEISDLVTV